MGLAADYLLAYFLIGWVAFVNNPPPTANRIRRLA